MLIRWQLAKLCRDFRWRGWSDDVAENTDFVARIEALERRWDRLQVAAVGYSWSKNFPLGLPLPQLPREILLKILWSHVADTHEMTRKQWHEQAEFALSCALVFKDWNVAATHLLYRGYFRLCEESFSHLKSSSPTPDTIMSAEMLLRTLENDRPHPRIISHLVLTPSPEVEKGFLEVALALGRCSALQIL